ncbi:MAG: ATP-binding protein [Bacteroidota bacterium]
MIKKSKPLFKNRKPSLIRILYIYPIVFFLIGLSTIFSYYSYQQYQRYRIQVEKLEREFPEKQQNELKFKVLAVKDFIFWVQAHPEKYIIQYLNRRADVAERLLDRNSNATLLPNGTFSAALADSLDTLNKSSLSKIVIINDDGAILYPETHSNHGRNPGSYGRLSGSIKTITLLKADTLISNISQNKLNAGAYLLTRNTRISGIRIGITFQPGQKISLLQEVVLDSLSKIKYSNEEYIFINTFDGLALLSKGKRQIPPISINQSKESNWKEIYAKELEYARSSEGGFYTYFWSNHPKVDRSEKTSYFSGVSGWKWIIGTGFFTHDINPVIDQLNAQLWNDIIFNLYRFIGFLIFLCIVAYFSMRHFAIRAKSNILEFLDFFKRASRGIQIIDSSKLAFAEFETLAQAANDMIYERERIKSVLSAEKSRLRYMIDAIPDLIFFKDAESKFLGCNKAFEKFVNKNSDQIIGLSEYDLYPKTEAEGYIYSDRQIIQSVEAVRSTRWTEHPYGQKCLFDTLKTPYFDSEGHLLGIIGISRDITEIEETRQRLILAKEKAEESDRLKTAFLTNMSHEIRTPMNAIIGFSDLLAEDDLSPEEKSDFILKIKSAGNSLMSLINDIIDIAKIEAGQLKVTPSDFDLHFILTELQGTFEELKNSSGKNKLDLLLVLPEDTDKLLVRTDPMRLQQILNNLLSNALKFTESGSIEFGYTLQNDTISFFVKDTGIGIISSDQQFLFQRFSQIDPSTTRKYGGAGLGLAISKNLVDLLGGTIDMAPNAEKGSVFCFTIPYKPVTEIPAKRSRMEPISINWNGKTILIAEDMMQNFQLMEALLRRSGVRLLHALNGQMAIDLVRSETDIHLILMDIHLPLKTGYEALKEILEIRPDIPVMSYTAFALPHEREKSINAGFVDFIPKPIKAESLFPMLDKYLHIHV